MKTVKPYLLDRCIKEKGISKKKLKFVTWSASRSSLNSCGRCRFLILFEWWNSWVHAVWSHFFLSWYLLSFSFSPQCPFHPLFCSSVQDEKDCISLYGGDGSVPQNVRSLYQSESESIGELLVTLEILPLNKVTIPPVICQQSHVTPSPSSFFLTQTSCFESLKVPAKMCKP